MITTDRSGSMLAKDVAPSRLVAARRAAGTFLDEVPDDVRVGAVAFNHKPTVLQTPTRDHAAVREALAGVKAAGSTATGDALAAALRTIRASRNPQAKKQPPAAIVLLSDGKSVRGRDALAVAEEARKAKIPVYTVALGTATGTIESKRRRRHDREHPGAARSRDARAGRRADGRQGVRDRRRRAARAGLQAARLASWRPRSRRRR